MVGSSHAGTTEDPQTKVVIIAAFAISSMHSRAAAAAHAQGGAPNCCSRHRYLAIGSPLSRLTVKLRGRAEAPALGAEGAQFPSARGAKPQAHHGPLQRLLGNPLTTGEPPAGDNNCGYGVLEPSYLWLVREFKDEPDPVPFLRAARCDPIRRNFEAVSGK